MGGESVEPRFPSLLHVCRQHRLRKPRQRCVKRFSLSLQRCPERRACPSACGRVSTLSGASRKRPMRGRCSTWICQWLFVLFLQCPFPLLAPCFPLPVPATGISFPVPPTWRQFPLLPSRCLCQQPASAFPSLQLGANSRSFLPVACACNRHQLPSNLAQQLRLCRKPPIALLPAVNPSTDTLAPDSATSSSSSSSCDGPAARCGSSRAAACWAPWPRSTPTCAACCTAGS